MQVRDGMSSVVLTVGPDHTLRQASKLMSKRNVGAAVVLDPDGEGPGIITERDILHSIALDQDVNGVTFAYVAEATRVLKFPIHARTVYIAIWIADNVIQPLEVQRQVDVARAALEKCGIDLQVRSISGFSAGALLDLEVVNLNNPTQRCGNPAL